MLFRSAIGPLTREQSLLRPEQNLSKFYKEKMKGLRECSAPKVEGGICAGHQGHGSQAG